MRKGLDGGEGRSAFLTVRALAAYVGNFFVDRDKFGNFRYVLKNIGSAPSFIGESYDNKPQCEKIIESVRNFIVTATVEVEGADGQES